jgi:hypothetical protein
MYVSKILLIRYRFQIYNRPVSLSVKVEESYARDGSFDAELTERPNRLYRETYVYIQHILSGNTKVVLRDIQKERRVLA